MKKIVIALAGVAALSGSPMTFADSVGAAELANTQALIKELQADKRQVMLDTLALNPEQLEKFTADLRRVPGRDEDAHDERQQPQNRLFVADYGGMTDVESKAIMKEAFKLRKDRIDLLEKTAGKLEKKLPATKVFQFVQVENKITALLDVAMAASVPIVTKTPGVGK